MKIDTHTHLLLKKETKPDWNLINFHFKIAKVHNLDVMCITEHIDAKYFTELYTELFINLKLGGSVLRDGIIQLPNSLVIVSGTEIPLKGGGEIGLHTDLSTILSLNKQNGFYSFDELVETVLGKTNDYIMIGNHLYVPGKWIEHVEEKLDKLDAIEMLPKENRKRPLYEALSKRLRKPLLSGSDSHVWTQLGLGYNIVDLPEYSIKAFKGALRENLVVMHISNEAERMSQASMLYRELLTSNI